MRPARGSRAVEVGGLGVTRAAGSAVLLACDAVCGRVAADHRAHATAVRDRVAMGRLTNRRAAPGLRHDAGVIRHGRVGAEAPPTMTVERVRRGDAFAGDNRDARTRQGMPVRQGQCSVSALCPHATNPSLVGGASAPTAGSSRRRCAAPAEMKASPSTGAHASARGTASTLARRTLRGAAGRALDGFFRNFLRGLLGHLLRRRRGGLAPACLARRGRG